MRTMRVSTGIFLAMALAVSISAFADIGMAPLWDKVASAAPVHTMDVMMVEAAKASTPVEGIMVANGAFAVMGCLGVALMMAGIVAILMAMAKGVLRQSGRLCRYMKRTAEWAMIKLKHLFGTVFRRAWGDWPSAIA